MTGDQTFTARQVPWTKIGAVIDDPDVDSAEAARLGGLDFDVELRPSGYWTEHERASDVTSDDPRPFVDRSGERTDEEGYWTFVPSRFATVRPDVDASHDDWFSYVSTDYRPVQYREAFAFMDGVNPRYVAAGTLSDGRKGFMIAQLPDLENVDVTVDGVDDPHQQYVVLQTSHDLSKSISVSVMMLRGKCMNMLTLPSFARDAPQRWTIPHVGDPHSKLEQAKHTLTNATRYGEVFRAMVTQYASVRITNDDLRQIARRVLPSRLKTIDAQVDAIVDHFVNDETVGFHGTGWGAINAVSTYMQWGRRSAVRTPQSEFTSPLEGDTARYVDKTAQLVMTRA